jgi:phosphoglycerate dehydrogenase-like enzyme
MNFEACGERARARLVEAGIDLKLVPKTGHRTPAEVAELVSGSVAALVSTDPFDASVFAQAEQLRVVARIGVGTDSVDLEAATRAGVAVTITSGANHDTVAEHTLALMLAVLRRIVENDQAVRAGRWSRAGELTPWELRGSSVGLVGYGNIGRAVAQRLSAFDVELLSTDPRGIDGNSPVEAVSLAELLERADVVSLHAPLTTATRRLIGRDELRQMRPNAVLINTARGGLVDQQALVEALESGRLRGAGLDVFEDEPLGESPLRSLPQVVLSPHIGGLSERSIAEMLDRASMQVLRVLSGQSEPDVVNPEALLHPKFARPVLEAALVGDFDAC